MVEQLKKTEKYFVLIYWTKGGSKKDKELLDYFSSKEEADAEEKRQKELDKHSDVKYDYDILVKTGKQVMEMW